jgi:serine protease Do
MMICVLDNPTSRLMGLVMGLGALACSDGGDATAGVRQAALFQQGTSTSVFDVQQDRSDEILRSRSTAIVEAANHVSPAVVSINTARNETVQRYWQTFTRRSQGLGSGFIINANGYILTNDHVVRGAQEILVTLPDGRDFAASRIGSDQLNDIAVLKIEGTDLPVAPLGTSRGLLIGEWAIAIGNPLGTLFSNTEPSVTAGVVSAVDRHLIPGENDQVVYLGMIQTDASINPGNSGGPLVNSAGQVIGVNSSIFSRSGGSEGLGFAIPIDRALRIAEDLVQEGEVRRAWPGFDVEAGDRDRFGRSRGVVVAGIDGRSPAAAGLRDGDRIVSANGSRMADPYDFETVLLGLRPGDPLELRVEGRANPISFNVGGLPSMAADRAAASGLELLTLNSGVQQEFGLSRSEGALITRIAPQLQRGTRLRSGDVILQINRTLITSADQALRLLQRVRGRVVVYLERDGEVRYTTFNQ